MHRDIPHTSQPPRTPRKTRAWLGALTLLLLATLAPLAHARGVDVEPIDRYYVVSIGGSKAGWMRETVEVLESGNILTASHLEMTIDRMGSPVRRVLKTSFLEDASGEAIEMVSTQNFGGQAIVTRYLFEEEGVRKTDEQGGRESESRQPLPGGEWFTPAEARAFIAKRLEAGAEEISYRVLDPTAGLTPISTRHSVIGETTTEVFGKAVPALEWEITNSILPGLRTREFVDENGDQLRYVTDVGGMTMEIVAADERFAKEEFDAPEMMASTLVQSNVAIDNPREARRGTYVVRIDRGEIPMFLNEGVQRVERLDEQSLRVRIDLDKPQAVELSEDERAELLASTVYIDADDPRIVRLASRALAEAALGEDGAPGEKARVFERFVRRFMEYRLLGVGFQTASEVCRTRQGDCTEYGVLLAAMCRTQGIPARVVSGLVYLDEFQGQEHIFGYHMWTQALIEDDQGVGRWVDLDAAVYPMDATHIAIDASPLAESDPVGAMIGTVQVLGQLSIEVEPAE